MTNKEDIDGDPACDPRFAAFLAVHFVGQILNDAFVIVNATTESGQPWHQSTKDTQQCEIENEDVSYGGDSNNVNENKIEPVANVFVIATSTPQNVTGATLKYTPVETSFIGQGDEDVEMNQSDFSKSTSMFINHLFDMSEVEKLIECEDSQIREKDSEYKVLLTQAITDILDSYIKIALGLSYDVTRQSAADYMTIKDSSSSDSEYSFLNDAIAINIEQNTTINKHDVENTDRMDNNDCEDTYIVPSVQITEVEHTHDGSTEECKEKNDVTRFENAYLSLNRDEQCFEDDENVLLEDLKGMTLQEVELLTAASSDENVCNQEEAAAKDKGEKSKELTATSAVSAISKKSLVIRCRNQGARLLACLRGWWRRKTPGKRKEHQNRFAGGVRGLCPLSPDAKRRAASLVDQRFLRSPSPSRSVIWKFNTVNEALANSSHWKNYTFEGQKNEGGEG